MFDAHTNFPYSTVLTAPIPATSGTSVSVQIGDGALFPATPFQVVIWTVGTQPLSTNAEIATVTSKITNVFTITRAQEGSSARTVVIGDQIAANATKKWWDDVETAITDVTNDLATHIADTANPHAVTKTQVGLGNVTDNAQYYSGGTDVAVADGGTGASTLTGIVKGNGTSAFTAVTAPSGAIVGDTDTQTLTNKTLTSPVVNTPTGIVKGDVGLGNVDNTSDTTKNSASATLTNKTLTSPTINTPIITTPTIRAYDGWQDANETWTYASGTGTNVGTFTIAGVDLTSKYTAGMKIKFTQTTVKYAIITKVAFSTDTTITIYMGTDYTIANAAISANYYSLMKTPAGFPMSATKWTITLSAANNRSTTATSFTSLTDTFALPIGAWALRFSALVDCTNGSTSGRQVFVTLSSDASTETDEGTTLIAGYSSGSQLNLTRTHLQSYTNVLLASATTYTLMGMVSGSSTTLNVLGSTLKPTTVRATCAYL